MARKPKAKPAPTEAQIFSELLSRACNEFGTKTIAQDFGVTVRSVQVWKNDSSKMNKISMIGARYVIDEIYKSQPR